MNSVALAADGSDTLVSLLQQSSIDIDYLKVGPWIGASHMRHCASICPVLLHCNDSVLSRRVDIAPLIALVDELQPPWLSVHLSFPYERLNALWQRFGLPFPLIAEHIAKQIAIQNLRLLMDACPVPVAVENQAHYRANGHDYLVRPDFINEVVMASDVHLLLDTGHAQVATQVHCHDVDTYITALPLERVIELHVHRPGTYRGRLRDLHLQLDTHNYQFIQSLLPQLPALQAVTLEHYGSAESLTTQLNTLRNLIDTYSAVPTIETSNRIASPPRSDTITSKPSISAGSN